MTLDNNSVPGLLDAHLSINFKYLSPWGWHQKLFLFVCFLRTLDNPEFVYILFKKHKTWKNSTYNWDHAMCGLQVAMGILVSNVQ